MGPGTRVSTGTPGPEPRVFSIPRGFSPEVRMATRSLTEDVNAPGWSPFRPTKDDPGAGQDNVACTLPDQEDLSHQHGARCAIPELAPGGGVRWAGPAFSRIHNTDLQPGEVDAADKSGRIEPHLVRSGSLRPIGQHLSLIHI